MLNVVSTRALADDDYSVTSETQPEQPEPVHENTLQLLTEKALHVTAILDEDGTIRYVSDSVEAVLGYGSAFFVGQNLLSFVHVADWPAVMSALRLSIGPRFGQLIEVRCRHASGTWRRLEVIARSRTADGSIPGVVINARDATERKWSAEHLQRHIETLQTISHVGHALRASRAPADICLTLLEGARTLAGVEGGVIFLRNMQGQLRVWQDIGPLRLRVRARRAPAAKTARTDAMVNGPRFFRLPPLDHEISDFGGWSVPLETEDRGIGVLEVYGRNLATPGIGEALSSLADLGASALERSRLHGELVAEERRVAHVVRRLVLAQEDERRRVALEVHDGLAQLTVAAQQYLEAFASRYQTRNRVRADQLDRALELVQRTVCEARLLINGLRPTVLHEFGLAAAVHFEVEAMRADGWQVECVASIGPDRMAPETEIALFRVAQEALANVRKHAGVTQVRVTLERRGQGIYLEIRDWGRGFRQSRLHPANDPSERIGLVGMRERISLIGGRCSVRSRPGYGTRVAVELQLPAPDGGARTPRITRSALRNECSTVDARGAVADTQPSQRG